MKVKANLNFPKITVVTPNYNQADFLEQAIQSVLNQRYPNLEYIIIDGGSIDGSVEIIKKYESELHYWVSEPDNGMYYAINKGFSKATGTIMCWINSDDVLWENSLFNVANIFNSNSAINWLQGNPTLINKKGNVFIQKEYFFSKYYFYFYTYEEPFSFIQQESSFWTKELWEKAGASLNTNYTIAADFDLWMRFFEFEKMYCTKLQLAAFREREGQKSSDKKLYLAETKKSLNVNFEMLRYSDKVLIKSILFLDKLTNIFRNKLIIKLNNKIQFKFIGKPKIIV